MLGAPGPDFGTWESTNSMKLLHPVRDLSLPIEFVIWTHNHAEWFLLALAEDLLLKLGQAHLSVSL